MSVCPRCQAAVAHGPANCPSCGANLLPEAADTLVHDQDPSYRETKILPDLIQSARNTTSSSLPGQFVSGTILADRYRIIGLVGKGGMGEVYKAEDTKLGQTVALKFLPDRMERDATALEFFHSEVRTARQVSHPGVCRVFDIGTVEGRHFLSMEFIDGDDLSSLLRRVGRFSSERAIEITRELCVALSAIHQAGILHRDFKPANVIIDSAGKVRITDFGIAGLADDVTEDELRMGTPAYMSPEQISGKDVSARSDIYALGLVMYEIFTGKQAFTADTVGELVKLQQTATPTNPSQHVKGLDPLVEKIIFQCLEKDPADRPASALHVAMALPGGNPMQLALDAGQTPSPEMVAASPKVGALKPAVAWACLAGGIVLLVVYAFAATKIGPHNRIPFNRSTEVLTARADEIAVELGYPNPPAESFSRFHYDLSISDYAKGDTSAEVWRKIEAGQPTIVMFANWQSPGYFRTLLQGNGERYVMPLLNPGDRSVWLDTRGRLIEFTAVPQSYVPPGNATPATDWTQAFLAAELDQAKFTETAPQWSPPFYADTRRAWEGVMPDHPEFPLRVEAASFQGRIVSFRLVYPWTKPDVQLTNYYSGRDWIGIFVLAGLGIGMLLAAAVVARRNIRSGVSDRKGAFKISLIVFGLVSFNWLLGVNHVPAFFPELDRFSHALRMGLYAGAATWLFYLALEPIVRRNLSDLIVSWNRLLAGDWRDPLVGRDVLIGTLAGVGHMILIFLGKLLERVVNGDFGVIPNPVNEALSGSRYLFAELLGGAVFGIVGGVALVCALGLLYLLLRRRALVALIIFLLFTTIEFLFFTHSLVYLPVTLGIAALWTVLMTRMGLVATVVHLTTFAWLQYTLFTVNLSAWYASGMFFTTALIVVMLVYGFRISTTRGIWSWNH